MTFEVFELPLRAAEVAARFGVKPATVNRWADRGLISSFRTPGGHRRYRLSDVEQTIRDEIALEARA